MTEAGPITCWRELREALIAQRKALGLSQEEVAFAMGGTQQQVSRWETDDATPSLSSLLAWMGALRMSLACVQLQPGAGLPPMAPQVRTRPETFAFAA